ncbi:MAG: pectin acetylesterase-family hydrolase [Leptospiraceae bacterium]|nr:pectin acetylesterase-family hydrolase [Leptospiraceae bacterium]
MLRFFILIFFLIGCNNDPNEKQKTFNRNLIIATGAVLYTPFQDVFPSSGSISIRQTSGFVTRNFEPSCSGVEGNKTFRFLVKKGSSKNLLINFMGGGACWDPKNCFGDFTTTYFNRLDSSPTYLIKFLFNGILDFSNTSNPMKDWNIIFIPYCTGDLHWGSNIASYTNPKTGVATKFNHKGFDNFLSVLKFIQTNTDYTPDSNSKILVAGQSAGGYGTIFNFPYIKEAFPNNEVNAFIDASNGVVVTDFQTNGSKNWNISSNLPTFVTGITSSFATTGELGEMIYRISQFYPTSRFSQFTTEYDGNQRFFYNVMQLIASGKTYSDTKEMWGNSNGFDTPDNVSCDWRNKMRTKVSYSGASSNYKYYIASGDVHTISTSKEFFTENSGGITTRDWLFNLLENKNWTNQDCRSSSNCKPPITKTSANGIVCN